MRPFFKNLFFITLLVLLVVAGYRFLQLNNLLSLDAVKATDTAQTVAPSHPPDLQMLAMQLIQAQQQTAESLSPDQNQGEAQEQSEDQLSEQQQIESEQINTATGSCSIPTRNSAKSPSNSSAPTRPRNPRSYYWVCCRVMSARR